MACAYKFGSGSAIIHYFITCKFWLGVTMLPPPPPLLLGELDGELGNEEPDAKDGVEGPKLDEGVKETPDPTGDPLVGKVTCRLLVELINCKFMLVF